MREMEWRDIWERHYIQYENGFDWLDLGVERSLVKES